MVAGYLGQIIKSSKPLFLHLAGSGDRNAVSRGDGSLLSLSKRSALPLKLAIHSRECEFTVISPDHGVGWDSELCIFRILARQY